MRTSSESSVPGAGVLKCNKCQCIIFLSRLCRRFSLLLVNLFGELAPNMYVKVEIPRCIALIYHDVIIVYAKLKEPNIHDPCCIPKKSHPKQSHVVAFIYISILMERKYPDFY